MAVKVKPGMYCPREEKLVAAQKQTHKARSLIVGPLTYGAAVKVGEWHCPDCGGPDYRKHMESEAEHRRLVPDRLVERFAVAGTPAECRRQIGSLFELPVDEVALVPFPAPGADRGELLHRLRSEVLDPIRNGSSAKRSDK